MACFLALLYLDLLISCHETLQISTMSTSMANFWPLIMGILTIIMLEDALEILFLLHFDEGKKGQKIFQMYIYTIKKNFFRVSESFHKNAQWNSGIIFERVSNKESNWLGSLKFDADTAVIFSQMNKTLKFTVPWYLLHNMTSH